MIGDDHTHKTNLDLVRRRLLRLLAAEDRAIGSAALRGKLAANKRDLFDEAIEELVDSGEVVELSAKQGGKRYRLNT